MDDLEEKQIFFNSIIEAIIASGYSDPGYYVDDHHGIPYIFDSYDNPRQSIAGDSPTAIIIDFAKVLEEDR